MTPLGTAIFGILGALFAAAVALMIWLALRDSGAITQALEQAGWTIERPKSGAVRWVARRNGATVEVTASGPKSQSVWTSLRLARDTGADDVLVTKKAPALIAADGALSGLVGFQPPPRWADAPPEFAAACDAFASDANAAARWLTTENRAAIIAYNRQHRPVAVRIYGGAIEARWAEAPRDAEQIPSVVALLETLAR